MNRFLHLAFIILLSASSYGQTSLLSIDFESVGGYSTNVPEFTDNGGDFFLRTDGSDISSYSVSNIQGSYYFAAQDIDGEGATLPLTLTINQVDISGKKDLTFKIMLAEDATLGWDASDYFSVEYDIDNSGTFNRLLYITGTGTNTSPLIDTDADGIGDGAEITSTFTEFTVNIPETGNTIDMKIIFKLNSGEEDIAIDNIRIIGFDENTATITTTGTLNPFKYEFTQGPSTSQTYTVSGSGLTNNITVSPPTNYELSTNNATFQSSAITLAHSGGNVAPTDIYIRLKSGLGIATYNENIEVSSTGASSKSISLSGEVTPVLPKIVFNEIFADPATDITGDANGDGTVDSGDDEFIELINNEDSPVDISGFTLSDASSVRHTFPANTIIEAQKDITVFGGGTPNGFNPDVVQIASSGALSLNNGGDNVILKDGSGNIVATYTYGSEGGEDQSLSRNPDITGDFEAHTLIANANGILFSPTKYTNGNLITPFTAPNIQTDKSSISNFIYQLAQGPSSVQTLSVSGANLTNNITVTPAANYEISKDNSTFQSTAITLTQSGGDVTSTPIYIRLKAGLAIAEYNGDIVLTSSGAPNKTISIIGNVIPVLPKIVINEIFADPATNITGDANSDGTNDSGDDEFIELINTEDSQVDISGYTISDATRIRHTFPANTIIAAQKDITVFGGGVPTGFNPGNVQVASSGALSLNNGGDNVILSDASGNIVTSYSYGPEGGSDQSLSRNPDVTGDFVKHTEIADANGALFSPTKYTNGTFITPLTIPNIQTDKSNLSNITYKKYSGPSNAVAVKVSGGYLTHDVTITPSDNLEISTDNSDFSSSEIVLVPNNGSLDETNLYIRLKEGLEIGSYSESVRFSSDDAQTRKLTCNATVTIPFPNAWVNEFHYDNTGTDENEFVEVALEYAHYYNLNDFDLVFYNGSTGKTYKTIGLNKFAVGKMQRSFTIFYTYPSGGIQNGPDGMALVYKGKVIQFISYEGSFKAINGPANKLTSRNIGVSESGAEDKNHSLQLIGLGKRYKDFEWIDPPASPGSVNAQQTLFDSHAVPLDSRYLFIVFLLIGLVITVKYIKW